MIFKVKIEEKYQKFDKASNDELAVLTKRQKNSNKLKLNFNIKRKL